MNELAERINRVITKKRIQHIIFEDRKIQSSEYEDIEKQMNELFFEYQKTKNDHDQLQLIFTENEMTQISSEFKDILSKTIQESFQRLVRVIEVLEYEVDILTEIFDEIISEEVFDEMMNEKMDHLIDLESVSEEKKEPKKKVEKKEKTRLDPHKLKTKSLTKKQLEERIICPICRENHMKIESVLTCCGHSFGKDCFRTFQEESNKCPVCFIDNPSYCEFRQRPYNRKGKDVTPEIIPGNSEVAFLIG